MSKVIYETDELVHDIIEVDVATRILAKQLKSFSWIDGREIDGLLDLFAFEAANRVYDHQVHIALPTCIILLGKGPASNHLATRFGGLPLISSAEGWPEEDSGAPMTFLGQFNFEDSLYQFEGDLPGDVLQLFGSSQWKTPFRTKDLKAIWKTKEELDTQVMSAPSGCEVLPEFFGVFHTSYDFVFAPNSAGAESTTQIANATKIGGLPWHIQGSLTEINDDNSAGPVLLCQFNSIQARHGVPYPWLNQAAPYSARVKNAGVQAQDNSIIFGDKGSIYVYLSDDGETYCEFESY